MSQLLLPIDEPMSMLETIAATFRSRPGQRIPAWELARIGGYGGWRTRVDECRKLLGMEIANVQERAGRRILSYYIYQPAAARWPAPVEEPCCVGR